MIKVENRVFYLEGKDYSYIFLVNDCDSLEHIYFGNKISYNKKEYIDYIINPYTPNKNNKNFNTNITGTPTEFGFYGKGDFNDPAFITKRYDGVYVSNLKYVDYKIEKGVKELNIMPSLRTADETLIVYLHDEISNIDIELYYIVINNSNVLTRYAKFINRSENTIYLNKAYSFSFDLLKNDYKLLKMHGNWASERKIEITDIPHGVTRIKSNNGESSHQLHPFIVLMDKDATEDTGECYSTSLIYSGSYALTVEKNETNLLRIQGGINDLNFSWKLENSCELVTPEAVICYSNKGLENISLSLSDYYREHLINPKFVYAKRPVVINSWEGMYFNVNNEKIKSFIDKAKEIGVDTFVLDDGWFTNRNIDDGGLGDWEIDYTKLPNGLKEISDYCKNSGLKFGLWFEPEMVAPDSNLAKEHDDYIIKIKESVPKQWRNQLILDFTRDEVVYSVYEKIVNIISSIDLSYMKWDMNRAMTDMYSKDLSFDNQGEFMHRYILGVYKLYNLITAKLPDLLIEGCAGGGARFDAGIMYYSPQIWTSDDNDPYMRSFVEYSTSIAYPISVMSCHIAAEKCHQTCRVTPFESRANIASLGPTGFELDPNTMTENELELSKEYIKKYNRIHDLILKGDYYRINNPYVSNYFISIIVSKDKNQAYLVGFKKMREVLEQPTIYKLKGLDPTSTYLIEELNLEVNGDTLMNFGLLVPYLDEDFASWSYNIIKK